MHTILGSSGVIGRETAKALKILGRPIRLVSRKPKKIHPEDQLISADLKDPGQVLNAVKGSQVVYLCAGFEYKLKVWKETWPLVMDNVIEACKRESSKLIFFDNVYCYGKVEGKMTEESPYKPSSKKGEVRAEIANRLMEAIKNGEVKGCIARSADFYGPNTPLSFFNVTVMENLNKGKTAQWMMDADQSHSMTYTPDAGKALAILGNSEKALGEIWHLPTAPPLTGRQYIELATKSFGADPKVMILKRWFLLILGIFIPAIKENMEMLYQVDSPYHFDSNKFEKAFEVRPTSYEEGIARTADFYKKNVN